jgi:hypothetical protein
VLGGNDTLEVDADIIHGVFKDSHPIATLMERVIILSLATIKSAGVEMQTPQEAG